MKKDYPTIMIIENKPGTTTGGLLQQCGYRVIEEESLGQAVEDVTDFTNRERPDVILLDVMMPGMDGWEVFGELLKDGETAGIPVVFLTARAELRDQARGLELGGVDYVTKPFNPLDLAPLVEDLLVRAQRGDVQERRRERLAELRQLLVSD